MWYVQKVFLKTVDATSQFSVGDIHGNFLVEEVSLWRLNVWFEDFMCAIVQWYLQCDSYSSCVKIRCWETVRENLQRNNHFLDLIPNNDSESRYRVYLCVIITVILEAL
jgi:hypothetical protein